MNTGKHFDSEIKILGVDCFCLLHCKWKPRGQCAMCVCVIVLLVEVPRVQILTLFLHCHLHLVGIPASFFFFSCLYSNEEAGQGDLGGPTLWNLSMVCVRLFVGV